jgi:ATP-dependent DNA helicase RecG
MDDSELEHLLTDLESDRVERKESVSDGDKIRQAICAFANDLPDHRKPGVVFVGVTDKGDCANLAITDQLLQNLGGMRSEGNILPLPSIIVQKKSLNGCELAVVIVQPADAPPVRFKGTPWIRAGPRRATASAEEERRLAEKRRWKDLPFDLHPVASTSQADLDIDYFHRVYLPASISRDVLMQNERSVEHQLVAVRFLSAEQASFPTILGLLVIGRLPSSSIPGAYIQFVRFDGIDLADPIRSQAEIHGPLSDLLNRLDDVLRANISTATDIVSQPTEVKRPDYPLAAIQQLARNAVMHRSYESSNAPILIYWFADRIEIHNPGGPFGRVTPENFGRGGITDYRNPNLAAAMKDLNYVQRFGAGIAIARREMTLNGNPEPEFIVGPGHIVAILRRRS